MELMKYVFDLSTLLLTSDSTTFLTDRNLYPLQTVPRV